MRIKLRVVPNAPKSEIIGPYGDALKVKIKAPPLDGKANEEVIRLFAELHKVPRSCVKIVGGETSRDKLIDIEERRA